MPALVTEDCPPRYPLSGSHRWPRASTSVEGPATMRVTQDLSRPPRSCREGSCTVGPTSAGGRPPSRRPCARPTPSTTSAIATASATCGRRCRGIDAIGRGSLPDDPSTRLEWAEINEAPLQNYRDRFQPAVTL